MSATPDPKLVHAVAGSIIEFLDTLDHSEQIKSAAPRTAAVTIDESVSAHSMASVRSNLEWNARRRA